MSTEIQKFIEAPAATAKFIALISAVRKITPEQAGQRYELEKFGFVRELDEKNIQDVTPISALGVFLDVISNGLTFSSGSKMVYMMSRNIKTGKKSQDGKDIYEKRLVYDTTPDGKIFQAQASGAIEFVTKPVIVYKGDDFAPYTNEDGRQIIMHKPKIPRESNEILAGYVFIVFKGGSREPYWMTQEDINRLRQYSARNNRKWNNGQWQDGEPNALYGGANGQIDSGFFGAKLIKHALKNVRKMGLASEFQADIDEADYTEVKQGELAQQLTKEITNGQPTQQPQQQPEFNSQGANIDDSDIF